MPFRGAVGSAKFAVSWTGCANPCCGETRAAARSIASGSRVPRPAIVAVCRRHGEHLSVLRRKVHRGGRIAAGTRKVLDAAWPRPGRHGQAAKGALEHRSVATLSGTPGARRDTHERDETQAIAGKDSHGAGCINDASGVKPKAAPGGQDGRICGMSDGGIDAGEPGGLEPPRRLSGGRCGRSRRQPCEARCRRRRRKRPHECPHLCGHQCRARCAARCTAKPAPARHGVQRLPKPRRSPQPAQPARASEARSATSAARSAGARRTKRMSGAVSGTSARRVGLSGKRSAQ